MIIESKFPSTHEAHQHQSTYTRTASLSRELHGLLWRVFLLIAASSLAMTVGIVLWGAAWLLGLT
jgi:hypothetical protein